MTHADTLQFHTRVDEWRATQFVQSHRVMRGLVDASTCPLHSHVVDVALHFTPLESFAKTHKVIAVELQGHGRTADTDRPLSLETMGDDIAALVRGVEKVKRIFG